MSGCVSENRPLNQIHPLSERCDDFVRFSVSILKQRDQGFSRKATINITGLYVDNEKKRQELYRKYKPIIEIIYAEFLINADGIRATAGAICEHSLQSSWLALAREEYKLVADTVYQCQLASETEPEIQRCVLLRAQGITDPDLEKPPV